MLPGTGRGNRRLEGGDPGADASHPEDSKLKPVPEAEVRAELERVLASTSFRYSERLRGFLKFVVEEELAGNGSQLKESVVALEILDRDASYDSGADSVVGVEARRLREKVQK